METVTKKKLYEGMFLVDSARAGSDWDGINAAIRKILERAEADIISIRKWDDRRLAYEIKHVGRGTYILVYFRADGEKIQGIEKAVQLSEHILRVLILSAEHMTDEDMEKDTPATRAEKEETRPIPAAETVKEEPKPVPAAETVEEEPKPVPAAAAETVEEAPVKVADDQAEPPVAGEPDKAEEVATVDEAVTKEVAETAGQTEQTEDVEPAEAEEESPPKTALDD